MATDTTAGVVRFLGTIPAPDDGGGATDGQLLGRFVGRRDAAAFAALARRHGPMVWGVCRRLLARHDAEDAFQATFLVLVRKASSVCPRERVGNWLPGVARRTALQARRAAGRRREQHVSDLPEPAAADRGHGHDLGGVLDEELARLPERYRAVVVLCDLEGRTRVEAARHLGVPEGSVGGWLARARGLLADRLTRRGVSLPAGAVAAVVSQAWASAVPPQVLSSTIRAVLVADARAVPTTASALAEGVLRAMFVSKLRTVAAVVLVAAVLASSAGLAYRSSAADPPAPGEKGKAGGQPAAADKKGEKTAAVGGNILRNGGFEDGDKAPAHWSQGAEIEGVEYVWDKKNGQKGKASLCLHKTAERYFPIAQWHQTVDRTGDSPALRVVAQVKAEGVTKAIVDVLFLDEKGEAIGHKWASYIGAREAGDQPVTHDWKGYAGRVDIPAGTKKLQVGLQIYGPGTVWFDEVSAEYVK